MRWIKSTVLVLCEKSIQASEVYEFEYLLEILVQKLETQQLLIVNLIHK